MSEGAGDGSGGATGVQPGALTALLQEVAASPERREEEPVSLSPGTILGRFEIIRELGRGGFGVVYEAKDRDLGRQVAVKLVRPGRITEEEGKVSREAEAIARLSHPNLITLFEVGRSEHGPFLVFELLRGKTLDLRIEEGSLPVQEAVHIATEVARGLAHAHAEGVIHRDLKPANVFITNKGQVKILDFGMAHAFGRRRLSGGTPAYMAPEQWEDAPEDERTDVFALGVMLYRMLTGEYPFPEGQGSWSAEPTAVRKLDVPGAPDLADLVEKMLDPVPTHRPRDGAAVLAALTPIKEKLRARPPDGKPPEHARRRKATFGDLLAELKRRHVFRVMVGYGVFAFAVLQVTEPVMHGAHLPEWVLTAVLVALALGFPVAVILAWVYDLTAQGVKRTASATDPGAPRFGTSRFLLPLAVSVAVLAIVAAGAFAWRAARREAAVTPSVAPSIAVLPFKDLSPEHDQEYFSDGMTEEILSALAKVKGLRVPGRVSSFYFKGKNVEPGEIAQKLGVTHLLEGSVRRSGNKLRISAEVVKASDGERIWSQTFNRDLADVFAIQDEISRDVVEALRVKLMPGQPLPAKEYRPTNQDAYQSYLLGKHFAQSLTSNSQMRAVAAFEKAVELDPAYAPAWAALAEARIVTGGLGAVPWSEARETALVAANHAAELGPDLPEALAARAQARLQEWDWPGAKADVDRALELGPENPQAISAMGSYLFQMGKDSVSIWRRVVESEPLDGRAWIRLGMTLSVAGQFAEADRAFARASEVDPDGNGANARTWLIVRARPAEALALCQGLRTDRQALECKVRAYHALGNASEAQRALDALIADVKDAKGNRPFANAALCAYLGKPDDAFDWLERARAEHVLALNSIKVNRDLRALHADPRWAAFLRKMNLPVDDGEGTTTSTTTAAPSIAVLPFADMSPKHDQEYFADGVAEEILSALAHVEGLKVVGRTSSFSFKGKSDDLKSIGEKLGASALLEGSVRKDGNRVRVTAQVIRASDGTQLWSQAFDKNLSKIFEVQGEIASAVVQALKVNRVASRSTSAQRMPTGSDEAYLLLLSSRKDLTSGSADGTRQAAKKLERALTLDPGYAAAWAELAQALRMQSEDAASAADLTELRQSAAKATGKALSLDPALAVAYVQRSTDRTWVLDWDGARADADRARALDPQSHDVRVWSAILEDAVGTPANLLAIAKAQADADPLNGGVWRGRGWALMRSGRFEESRSAFNKALDISPGSSIARYSLALSHLLCREPERALQVAEEIPVGSPLRLIATALAQHSLGRNAESQAALQELVAKWSYNAAYNVAQVHAWRGQRGLAFDWLGRAITQHDSALPWIRNDPFLRNLHADPRWKPFLRRMNLPPD